MQEGDPLEDKVAQLNQAIQGFSAKITELEACSLLSTPPEEREQREQTVKVAVQNIKSMNEKCSKFFEESSQIQTRLIGNAELQRVTQQLQSVQGKVSKRKDFIITLPALERM